MNILYYDCFSGISGDMNLAAMLDLGLDEGYLRRELAKLGLNREFELLVLREARGGIMGTRVEVRAPATPQKDACQHEHHERHCHADSRNLAAIRALICSSPLDEDVKKTSLDIFAKVAEAEASVHGQPVEAVHFHEVGAIDSIVDIVGAALGLKALAVEAVWSAPPELGSGFAQCAHGLMPVPAPATEAILRGLPTRRGAQPFEATTPTGAAILATLAEKFTEAPVMTVLKTGYGLGHFSSEKPNMLRVHLAHVFEEDGIKRGNARLLQCNIDDMTGEHLAALLSLLLEEGAMDAHCTPIIMKKGRPAVQISLLCAAAEEERFKRLLFRHSSTLGIKSIPLEKSELSRRVMHVATSFGPVAMKEALLEGAVVRAKPEFSDCLAIARRENLTLAEVYAFVNREYEKKRLL